MNEGGLEWMVGEGYTMMDAHNTLQCPEQMADFIQHCLEREGIVLPEALKEMYDMMGKAVNYYLATWDPRCALLYSDLVETSDWRKYTFSIERWDYGNSGTPIQVQKDELEKLETFKYVPGMDEGFFSEFYDKNTEGMRYKMFFANDDVILDYFRGFAIHGDLTSHVEEFSYGTDKEGKQIEGMGNALDAFHNFFWNEQGKLRMVLDEDGNEFHRHGYYTGSRKDNLSLLEHVTEIMASAGLVWFCSPMARKFRREHHELFYLADNYHEFICFDRMLFAPDQYEKVEMSPTCCNSCGLDSYCVEIIPGSSQGPLQVCNGCLSKNRPPLPDATCGTKFCKHIECPHNKYNGMGEKGRYAMHSANPLNNFITQKPREHRTTPVLAHEEFEMQMG